MKMNENGTRKLYDEAVIDDVLYDYHAQQIEFEPTDFKGAIILSLEEAKEYETMIHNFLELFESQYKDSSEWNYYVILHHLLERRIQCVEKSDEQ